jgi:ribonucleotide monophosphatase NagD (HAD superfamily)
MPMFAGAQALGMTGVLVRSGKFREDDLQRGSPNPDHVIDDVRRYLTCSTSCTERVL